MKFFDNGFYLRSTCNCWVKKKRNYAPNHTCKLNGTLPKSRNVFLYLVWFKRIYFKFTILQSKTNYIYKTTEDLNESLRLIEFISSTFVLKLDICFGSNKLNFQIIKNI